MIKYFVISVVLLFAAPHALSAASAPTKEVCVMQKSGTASQPKKVCKTVKTHKKLPVASDKK